MVALIMGGAQRTTFPGPGNKVLVLMGKTNATYSSSVVICKSLCYASTQY